MQGRAQDVDARAWLMIRVALSPCDWPRSTARCGTVIWRPCGAATSSTGLNLTCTYISRKSH